MFLLFDIGNTTITIGVHNQQEYLHAWKINTYTKRTADEYSMLVTSFLQTIDLSLDMIEQVLVSSVVPQLEQTLRWFCENNQLPSPFFSTATATSNIINKLDNPLEIGPDLLTAAAAAHQKYPDVNKIIIDLGTATTITVVTDSGHFLGGAIAPGLETSMQSLINNTALLTMPQESADDLKAIGTSTTACLQSGAIYGYSGMIDNLLANMLEELGDPAPLILTTGGQAQFMQTKSVFEKKYEQNLIFDGLRLIYELNK